MIVKKIIQNKNGISLVSVMIASALVAGLSLTVMKIMGNVNSSKIFAESVADEAALKANIQMLLENKKHCSISLKGKKFDKSDIDFNNQDINRGTSSFTESSEGLDIDLWYSDAEGTIQTRKKYNGRDNPGTSDKSDFGKLTIKSLKLVMNNATSNSDNDYSSGELSDVGSIVAIYERPINGKGKTREARYVFDINVKMTTDSSGESEIEECALSLDTDDEEEGFDYPSGCSFGFQYTTNSTERNREDVFMTKPGFYGIKLVDDGNVDDDNYLNIRARCTSSKGNEFKEYLRSKCSFSFGQRDNSNNDNSENRYPENYTRAYFSSTSTAFKTFEFEGNVNEDDRLYTQISCNSGYENTELVDWIKNTCLHCIGQSDNDRDRSIDVDSCAPIRTTGFSSTFGWTQIKLQGTLDDNDTLFFGIFCGHQYSRYVIKSDTI